MKYANIIKASLAVVLVATGAAIAPAASAATIEDTGLPKGFSSWAELFAVQGPLNDTGREIQRVASTQPGSGFTSYVLDVPSRSLTLYWRGTPSAVEQQAIDAPRQRGTTINIVAATYSREQLDAQSALIEQDAGQTSARRLLTITPQPDGSGIRVGVSAPGVATGARVSAESLDQDLPHVRAAIAYGGVTVVAEQPAPTYSREADSAPFWGGNLIFTGNFAAACTGGFAATRPSTHQNYMITAAHCAEGQPGTTWGSGSGNLLGTAELATNARDAMFVNTTPNGGSTATMYDGPAIFVAGQQSKPVEGAVHVGVGSYVCLSGSLTGVVCNTVVKNTTRSECSAILGCVELIDALSPSGQLIAGEGDSGGPVFVNAFNNSAALAVGLIHGAYDTVNLSCNNPLHNHFPNYPATRVCSTGVSFTDVLDAVAPISGMKIATVGGQPTVNGDDRADLLGRTPSGDLVVYHNAGGSGFGTFLPTSATVGTGWNGFSAINLADVNGDGRADLFTRTSAGSLLVYLNIGGSGFGTFSGTPSTVGTGWNGFPDIELGDINADGRADLLTRTSAGALLVYLNVGGTGLGTFSGSPSTVGTGWGGFNWVTLGDINADGRADLMGRTNTGDLIVYINVGGSGLGTFSGTPSTVGTGWSGFSQINLDDLNGDGRADLLARNSAGALIVYLNVGGSGFGTFNGTPSTVGTGWSGFSEVTLG